MTVASAAKKVKHKKRAALPNFEVAPQARPLGPWSGKYTPAYEVIFYREGDPRKKIGSREVNLQSIVSIETSKNIGAVAGSWRIVLKDVRALHAIRQMDVVVIRLKGHNAELTTVLHGLVDEVDIEGASEVSNATENTVISGRCMAKYLQVTSFFLPVWAPGTGVPTTLTFGLGDPQGKAGEAGVGEARSKHGNTPKEIFGYVFRHYITGQEGEVKGFPPVVGTSGIPVARYWLNKDTRFELIKNKDGSFFKPLFLQFDENTCDQALTELEVKGLTEAWVDEFGYVVYRPPGWALPVNYTLSTEGMLNWELTDSDVGMATYVEVIPAAAQAVGSGAAEALLAGRAPVPSSYVAPWQGAKGQEGDEGGSFADPEFVINSDKQGRITGVGRKNYWWKRQRKYGLRPMQVTSPLLATHAQAQAQAEGLLEFFGNRLVKSATITIPGEPIVRLGTTILVTGSFRGRPIERTYYVEGVKHEYTEGTKYTTTLELTHGRDPSDPRWHQMIIPAGPKSLSEVGGVAREHTANEPSGIAGGVSVIPGAKASLLSNGKATAPAEAPQAVQNMIAAGNLLAGKPYSFGGAHGQSLEQVQPAYDCSSAVDFVLFHGGLLKNETPPSGTLASYGEGGSGRWVTIFANPDHCFMFVAGLRFEFKHTGTFGGWEGGARSTEGFTARHPQGF